MCKVPLSELKKTHETLCRMLKSRICTPLTIAEAEAIKVSIEREIAEREAEEKNGQLPSE